MLDRKVFADIVARYGTPDIDLFASRLSHQLPNYVSWEPDPGAAAMDAFSLHWGYCFSMHFLLSASSVGYYAKYTKTRRLVFW